MEFPDELNQIIEFTKNNNIDINWSFSLLSKDKNDYKFDTTQGTIVYRIDINENSRFFIWMKNMDNAIVINKFICNTLRLESHEVFIKNSMKIFIDFDFKPDDFELKDFKDYLDINHLTLIDDVIDNICGFISGYILEKIKLTFHTHVENFDYLLTTRNRYNKISFHLITNLISNVSDIKNDINKLIDQIQADKNIDEEIQKIILNGIDLQPYRKNASLSVPYGMKKYDYGYAMNIIQHDWTFNNQSYFITSIDANSIVLYDITDTKKSNGKMITLDDKDIPPNVKEVLMRYKEIKSENMDAFTIDGCRYHTESRSILLRRLKPSFCNICKKNHDRDNTLLINEFNGVGYYKCKKIAMKPIRFTFTEFNKPHDFIKYVKNNSNQIEKELGNKDNYNGYDKNAGYE